MQGIRESAGWGPASWWPRSNFVEFKDTNRSPSFSGNWRRCFPLGRRLSNGERHRRVGYARAATFHGVSGDPRRKENLFSPSEMVAPILNSDAFQLWTSTVRAGTPKNSEEIPRRSVDFPASLSP